MEGAFHPIQGALHLAHGMYAEPACASTLFRGACHDVCGMQQDSERAAGDSIGTSMATQCAGRASMNAMEVPDTTAHTTTDASMAAVDADPWIVHACGPLARAEHEVKRASRLTFDATDGMIGLPRGTRCATLGPWSSPPRERRRSS